MYFSGKFIEPSWSKIIMMSSSRKKLNYNFKKSSLTLTILLIILLLLFIYKTNKILNIYTTFLFS